MAKKTESIEKIMVKIGNFNCSQPSNLTPASVPPVIITAIVIPIPEYLI